MELGRAVGEVLFPFDDVSCAPSLADGDGFLPRQKRDVTPLVGRAVPRSTRPPQP
jgi:hypothetical protein